jgi:hypothetical protein
MRTPLQAVRSILLFLICLCTWRPAAAQLATVPARPATLTVDEIVNNLVRRNLERAQALSTFQGTRVYRLDYHGFPGSRSAEMIVDVKYQSPATEEFTI